MKRINILTLIVSAMLLSACGQSSSAQPTSSAPVEVMPAVVSASGKLVPAHWAGLSFQASGRVTVLDAQAGDEVKTGDVLAQLDDTDARLAVAQAEAALAVAQAQLAQLKAGPQPEQIAAAEQAVKSADAAVWSASAQLGRLQEGASEADLAAAEAAVAAATAQLKMAQDTYDRVKEIGGTPEEQARAALNTATANHVAAQKRLDQLEAGPTKNELDATRAALAAARAQQATAQAQLDLLKAGATQEQIAVVEAGVKQAQIAVDTARAQLAKLQIVAPFDGTLSSVSIRQGELAVAGQPIVTLGDLSVLRAETTDLSETDIARVREGQVVNVTFDALPGKTLAGTVTRIAPMSSQGQGGVNFTVIVELDQNDPALRWGMTAFVDIQVDK